MRNFYRRSLLITSLILLTSTLLITILNGDIIAQNDSSYAETQYRLELNLPMPYVPADGKTYPLILQVVNKEGQPRFLTEDAVIKLSSSNITIGHTEQTILLKAGESSTIIPFKSTFNIGYTNITASASGLLSGATTIRTVGISGAPAKLVLHSLPNKVLAKAGGKAIVVVELRDGNGLPARASEDLIVSLFSSITSVGVTDPTLIIRRNSTFGTAYFYPTNQPGTTEIKAVTSGLESAKAEVTTVAYNPNKLSVYLLPPILPKQSRGAVIVQIQDPYGRPIVAPKDIKVILTSNDTSTAQLDTNILIIPQGMSYGGASITTGNITGEAAIYAAAQAYEGSSSTLSVREAQEAVEGRLLLSSLPQLIPDGRVHTVLSVIMMNDNLTNPVRPPYPTQIHLSSSNTRVGEVSEVVLNENGYVYANFTSYTVGSTAITAVADNFDSSQTAVAVVEQAKFRLNLQVCPSLIPIDLPHKPIVLIEVQNANGEPREAEAEVKIQLYSSNTRVGKVEQLLVIKEGESSGLSFFELSSELGNTTITAAAPNFIAASATAATFRAGPSNIYLSIEPSIVIADGSTTQNIFITLQDMFGYPARAPADIKLTLSTSNEAIGTLQTSLTMPKHSTWISTYFTKSSTQGSTQIIAHAEGLQPSAKTLSTILLNLDVNLYASTTKVYTYERVSIYSSIQFEGRPISGAEIKWSTVANLLNAASKSDIEGLAKATFTSPIEGEYVVKVTVAKAGFKPVESSVKVSVKPRPLYVEVKAPPEIRTFEEVEISIKVVDDGRPVEGAKVNIKPSQGSLVMVNDITNVQGVSKAVYKCNEPSKVALNFVINKTGYIIYNGSTIINVKPQPLTIALRANASAIGVNNALEVKASVISGDRAVEGASLNWNVVGGTILAKSDVTDTQGVGTLILKSEEADTLTIDVSAAKKGYTSALTSINVKILPLPFYQSMATLAFWQKNPLVTSMVAALAIVCFFLFRAVRRKAATNKDELEFTGEI